MKKVRNVCIVAALAALILGAYTHAEGAVSPKDYGAVGDGKTDDSDAFVQALQAASGELVVPEGRYLLKDVKIPDGTSVRGVGVKSVIAMVPGATAALFPGNDCRLSDLVFVGDPGDTARAVEHGMVRLDSVSRVTLEGLTFRDVPRAAIATDHVREFRVTRCRFETVGLAVLIVFSNRGMITENIVLNAEVHGMQFWGNWEFERMECADLIFANNYVKDGGRGAIWGTGARRVVMTGNVIDGAKDIGLDLEWCEDCAITGNTTRNCDNAGIALFLSCKNVAIVGNSVVVADGKVGRRDGIWLTGTNKSIFKDDRGHSVISITGNTIVAEGGLRRHGINIGSGSNIVCAANVMHNADVMDLAGTLTDRSLLEELGESMTVIPLSQEWRFKTDPKDEGVAGGWFSEDFDDGSWAVVKSDLDCGYERQGFEGYTGYAWYRCALPALPERMRAFTYLHFGAVDEQAWVYLNGELIAKHTETSTGRDAGSLWEEPFTVDVSKTLRTDGPNVLAVRTHNKALMGGIWKPVHLVTSDMPADEARQRDAIVLLAPRDGGE